MKNKQISREEFEKFQFSTKYWDEHGGKPNKRPFWYEEGQPETGKTTKIFLSVTMYPDWASFAPAAELARTAAIVRYDMYRSAFAKISTGYELSENPHYLLEKPIWMSGDRPTIWLNILCPTNEEFLKTLQIARARADEMLGGRRTATSVGELFSEPLFLPYPPDWCQADFQTIGGLFRQKYAR